MNKQLETFSRATLKDQLMEVTPKQLKMFMRMYSHTNLEASVSDVVDAMPIDKLDWAMTQVNKTVERNN